MKKCPPVEQGRMKWAVEVLVEKTPTYGAGKDEKMPTCAAGTDEMSGYFLSKQMPTCRAGKDEMGFRLFRDKNAHLWSRDG
jgi:hypothetical protein